MGGAKDESFIEERLEALADLCGTVEVVVYEFNKTIAHKEVFFYFNQFGEEKVAGVQVWFVDILHKYSGNTPYL